MAQDTRKTDQSYWDHGYQQRHPMQPVQDDPVRFRIEHKFLEIFRKLDLDGKDVLEIGGGGSEWLARLAIDNRASRFTCLDYSPDGCMLTREFAESRGLDNVVVEQRDLFLGPEGGKRYDVVYSLGVVEHFERLDEALRAVARFAAPSGAILTVIPNMSGIIGRLTRWLNREVYDIHVPHDLGSFRAGHRAAGLEVVESGYLGSTNFGVLSSCFDRPAGWKYRTYVWLSRLTKLLNLLESRTGELPVSKTFSPYIYAISRHP